MAEVVKEAVKVRVAVRGDINNPDFKGVHAAGLWWPCDEPTTADLESDDGATGAAQVDQDTNKVKSVYTLKQKLAQLYVLEGRQPLENGRWSEPNFPLAGVPGNQNQAKPPTAPSRIKLTILDRRGTDGAWESERKAQAEKAGSTPAGAGTGGASSQTGTGQGQQHPAGGGQGSGKKGQQ